MKKNCSYFLSQSVFHTQKVATNFEEQNKKESGQLVKKQKSYSKSTNVNKIPKKLKISSLKIYKFINKVYKGAGIFIKPQNLSK